MPSFDVLVGDGDGGPVRLSKKARNVHMHVLGLSEQGKSFFLEHLIRQDIKNGAGVCLIDPHGHVYEHLVDWMAANRVQNRCDIHLIDLAAGRWSVGFNPLCRGNVPIDARVGAFTDACQVIWGDDESMGHRTLARLMWLVLTTLAGHQMSIREATILTNKAFKAQRRELVRALGNQSLSDEWDEVDAQPAHEQVAQFVAVRNRFRALTTTPVIRSMLGETSHVLDLTACMRRGDIVLVNLATKDRIDPQAARLLGALLTADMYYCARARDELEAAQQPFYAYIDECPEYINQKVVKALDETRKYGLHYVLSHQRLNQLGAKSDDPLRAGVMDGAQNKAIFLQENTDDTAALGELLFGKQFDFEKPKESLIRPVQVGVEKEILRGGGEANGLSAGIASGAGAGAGGYISTPDFDDAIPTIGKAENNSEFETKSSSETYVKSDTWHEAYVPVYKDMPTATVGKEEWLHHSAVAIRQLQPRTGFIYRADDRQAIKFTTPDVHLARPTDRQIDDFYTAVIAQSPSCRLTAEIELDVVSRRQQLLGQVTLTDPDDERQFRSNLPD